MRYLFGEFVLDTGIRQLLHGDEEKHLEPKAFELIELLVARRPQAVAKAEIHERLWPGTFVSDSSLTGLVAQLRKALGQRGRDQQFVRTVHGYGYAFAADVGTTGAAAAGGRGTHRVIWEGRVLPLADGENVLGRDERVAVRIDAPGVSRRHARIVVAADETTLEDLASKNGTYLEERRLQGAPVRITDGSTFRLGRQLLVFRSSVQAPSTLSEP